jgi:hypothetical protein
MLSKPARSSCSQSLPAESDGLSEANRKLLGQGSVFRDGVIFPIAISSGRVTGEEVRLESTDIHGFHTFVSYANARAFGVTPITVDSFWVRIRRTCFLTGLKFANDHDQRNEAQFQVSYTHRPSGIYASFSGRYDSGVPAMSSPERRSRSSLREGFDPRLYDKDRLSARACPAPDDSRFLGGCGPDAEGTRVDESPV